MKIRGSYTWSAFSNIKATGLQSAGWVPAQNPWRWDKTWLKDSQFLAGESEGNPWLAKPDCKKSTKLPGGTSQNPKIFLRHGHVGEDTSLHSRILHLPVFHAPASVSPPLCFARDHMMPRNEQLHSTHIPQSHNWADGKVQHAAYVVRKKDTKGVYWGLSGQMTGDRSQMWDLSENITTVFLCSLYCCVEVMSRVLYIRKWWK